MHFSTFDPTLGIAAGVVGTESDSALEIVNAPPIETGLKLLPILLGVGALWVLFRGAR